jgi:hypothetical protein
MPFSLPENIDALSVDELQALIDQGLDEFKLLGVTPQSDEATVAEAERIAPLIRQARVTQKAAEAAASDRANRAQAVLLDLETPVEPDPEPEPEPGGEPEPTEVLVPEVIPTPELVPASAAAPRPAPASPARRAAANAAPPAVRPKPNAVATLNASADVPGFPTGQPLDGLDAVCAAMIARMKGFPSSPVGDGPVRHRYGVASLRLGGFDNLVQDQGMDDYGLVWAAGKETRLPGGSLTAAGGWCAPSETLYDLCQYESVDGILDLPEIMVSRGGIRWTEGPDFADIYDGCGFFQTEAQAIAGTAKTCCQVECPTFDEIRLDLVGLCVKAPLLVNAAYPELTRRFMEGAMVAHQHKVNASILATISAAGGTASTLTGSVDTTTQSLNALEMAAIGMRYRYRMAQTASIEVVAPFWLKAAIRADWGLRQYPTDVSDAAIASWFMARGMSVQWVYDWQNLVVSGCTAIVPSTVDVLMYPAGTWVRGRADVINIDAVYDSTGLEANMYTALFMEEGILAVQRCTHTCKFTLQLCATGRVGAADIDTCLDFFGGTALSTSGTSAGAWLPSGSVPPGDFNALQDASPAIAASPTTAWTTGQKVTAGDGDTAHWNGTAWVRGAA